VSNATQAPAYFKLGKAGLTWCAPPWFATSGSRVFEPMIHGCHAEC
jgi:hypothetical protein